MIILLIITGSILLLFFGFALHASMNEPHSDEDQFAALISIIVLVLVIGCAVGLYQGRHRPLCQADIVEVVP